MFVAATVTIHVGKHFPRVSAPEIDLVLKYLSFMFSVENSQHEEKRLRGYLVVIIGDTSNINICIGRITNKKNCLHR